MRSMPKSTILPYYNDYFGVTYPLPKLDLIAIPGNYEAGAMENWGAITFIDNAMLFDPATSSPATRETIYVVSRTRWRINGRATSSPWAGGTISG